MAHHRVAQRRVERRYRLVGEDQPRPLHEGAGDGDALLLAAGEGVGAALAAVAQPDPVEAGQRLGLLLLGEGRGEARQQSPLRPSAPESTLSSTVCRFTRLNCWKIIADLAAQRAQLGPLGAVTSRPKIEIRPSVGSMSRLMQRSSVDLPEPERPRTARNSPSRTSR